MADPHADQRLAAIMAADVAGYSRLMEADERATVATLDAYRAVFQERVAGNGGRIVDTAGDSVLAVFASAIGAVEAAIAIQTELGNRNETLPEDQRMRFRLGVNLGDVIEKDAVSVYGSGVNVAARLEGLAEPGDIMISEDVRRQVVGKLKRTFEDAGAHEVKNIAEPVRAYRVFAEGAVVPESKPVTTPSSSPRRDTTARWVTAAIATVVVVTVAGAGAWWFGIRSEPPPPLEDTASVARMAFPLPKEPSIAVLPFDKLSPTDAHDYIADGLAENVISALSQVRGMLVIARNSTFTYKGQAVDVRRVAEEQGVRTAPAARAGVRRGAARG